MWFTVKIDSQKILILLYKQQFIFNTIKKNVTYKTGECNTGSVKNRIANKKRCLQQRLREHFASSNNVAFLPKKNCIDYMAFIYLGKLFALQQCTMEHFFSEVTSSFLCSFETLKQKISKIIQKTSKVLNSVHRFK